MEVARKVHTMIPSRKNIVSKSKHTCLHPSCKHKQHGGTWENRAREFPFSISRQGWVIGLKKNTHTHTHTTGVSKSDFPKVARDAQTFLHLFDTLIMLSTITKLVGGGIAASCYNNNIRYTLLKNNTVFKKHSHITAQIHCCSRAVVRNISQHKPLGGLSYVGFGRLS